MYKTNEDWARVVGEIIILLALPLFLYGEFRDICRGRWRLPTSEHWFGLFRVLNVVFVIFVLVALVLRCIRNENEGVILSICLLIGWLNSVQFLAAWKSTGIFPLAVHNVIKKALFAHFLPCYLVYLMAFSSATWVSGWS